MGLRCSRSTSVICGCSLGSHRVSVMISYDLVPVKMVDSAVRSPAWWCEPNSSGSVEVLNLLGAAHGGKVRMSDYAVVREKCCSSESASIVSTWNEDYLR